MKPRLYFSAEIGFSSDIPTYSGGLGVLAGDHLKAAADKCIPMVGITLLYRQGYFRQHLGADGWQTESYPEFMPEPLLKSVGETVSITLRGREVKVALWRTDIVGHTGGRIPIILLDSDVEGNHEDDRKICQRLYGGGTEDRLLQEAILGFAGVEAAQRLYPDYQKLHLNEGHTAFAPLALLNKGEDLDVVRANCHFTTHTPVPAGHDVFPWEMAEPVLGSLLPDNIRSLASEAQLSMSELALSLSSGANGVSELHGQVAREMFPGRDIGHVTNGVHHLTWVSDPMAAFFDRELTGWRTDAKVLRRATEISSEGLVDAHKQAKKQLLSYANAHTNRGYSPDILTIGFARRAAAYKRATLLFRDSDRLARICKGKVQFLFAGKAHPRDEAGHRLIQQVTQAASEMGDEVRIGYLVNYTMWTGRLMTAGVDVWLNTPLRPHEASGTSGMKAAINGVPSASILDGWWAEAAEDNENGWNIGKIDACDDEADAESLYQTLEHRIIPAYYEEPGRWATIMKNAIVTGAQMTASRMLNDYVDQYYT